MNEIGVPLKENQASPRMDYSEKGFRLLARSLPDGACVLFDRELRYLMVEGAGLCAAGLDPDWMIGKTIWECFPPETCSIVAPLFQSIISGEVINSEVSYQGMSLSLHGTPIHIKDGIVLAGMCLIHDITSRKKTEWRIQEQKNEIETFNRLAYAVSRSLDRNEILRELQEQLHSKLGIPSGAIYILNWKTEEFSMHSIWGVSETLDFKLRSNERPCTPGKRLLHTPSITMLFPCKTHVEDKYCAYTDCFCQCKACLQVPFVAHGKVYGALLLFGHHYSLVSTGRLSCFMTLGNHIGAALANADTYLEALENKLQCESLSRMSQNIYESERIRLSSELHDEIGQHLMALKYAMRLIEYGKRSDMTRGVKLVEEVVDTLIQQVREMSRELRPRTLDDFGLIPSVEWMVKRAETQLGLKIAFHHNFPLDRLPSDVEWSIYRFLEEGVTHIARHAETDHAEICLWRFKNSLLIKIKDAGKGFQPDEYSTSKETMGFHGMKDRIAMLGGELKIHSRPGFGAVLFAELPIIQKEEE